MAEMKLADVPQLTLFYANGIGKSSAHGWHQKAGFYWKHTDGKTYLVADPDGVIDLKVFSGLTPSTCKYSGDGEHPIRGYAVCERTAILSARADCVIEVVRPEPEVVPLRQHTASEEW